MDGAKRAAYKAVKAAETAQRVVGKTQKSLEANTARLRPAKSGTDSQEKGSADESALVVKQASEFAEQALSFSKEAETAAESRTAGKQVKRDAAVAKRAAAQAEKAAADVKVFVRKGDLTGAKRAAYIAKRAANSAS